MMKITNFFYLLLIVCLLGCSREEHTDEQGSSCGKVSNVSFSASSSTITINYSSGNGTNSYKIEYGLTGFSQGSGTSFTTSNTYAEIGDLASSTTYDFYITGICSSTESSAPYKLSSVTTKPSQCKGNTSVQFYQYNLNELILQFSYSSGSVYQYEVEYGPAGFQLGTGIRQKTEGWNTSISIKNLPYETAYDFYVRTFCSDGDPNQFKKFTYTTGTSCPKPFNLNSYVISGSCNVELGATRGFTWDSYGSPQSYTISLIQDVNSAPTAQTFTTSNKSIAISNMYCNWKGFYVKSNCGDKSSEWAGPFIF
ncbi:hypothetical protein [Epilithonimonas zeae]|uniref:hypothetical protein n=1 Tax=Epilithonimonas zeae TaxID=1416779 RepID=UPI00200C89BA|nr:hypothetical protein [Epilithonimonas zeae]UQB67547.1 hypothetical protein KI430_10900 [Epilithonimonas zeae]